MKLRELLDHLTPGLKKPFQQQLELSAALAPDEVEVPFILKVLTALGTWFGALLISMVVFGMHLQDFELVTVFIAIILISIAGFLSRKKKQHLFIVQIIWILIVAAQVLAAAGLHEANASQQESFLVLGCLNLISCVAVKGVIVRFATLVANSTFITLAMMESQFREGMLFFPIFILIFGLVVWSQELALSRRSSQVWSALAYGLPVSLTIVLTLWKLPLLGVFSSVIWLVVSYLRASFPLRGIALLLLHGFLFLFYYDLSISLLDKSIYVITTGLLLLLLAFFFRPPRKLKKKALELPMALVKSAALVALAGATIGFVVYQKQALLVSGRTVLLPLAPADPRSLLQGDFMKLHYRLARDLRQGHSLSDIPRQGKLVVKVDDDDVARFIRIDSRAREESGELLIDYRIRESLSDGVRIGANDFFFEEGSAVIYHDASYGELRISPEGEAILVGLRDANKQPLGRTIFDAL